MGRRDVDVRRWAAPTAAPTDGPIATAGPAWWRSAAPAAVLLLTWLVTLPWTYHRMFPDGISYVAVAEHYLAGRWDVAVNAYWSPLWSWLLVPSLALGADGLLASRVAGLLAALLLLYALHRWLRRLAPGGAAAVLVLAALVPFLVRQASLATPDLLLAALLLLFADLATRRSVLRGSRQAVLTGVVAGAAYLAKLFALPFVLAATPLLWAVHLRRGASRSTVLRSAGLHLLAFLTVVAAWSAVLSVDTGRPTVGTAGAVNLDVAAAGSPGSPIYSQGLFDPPHPHAANAWEDPGSLPPARPAGGGAAGARARQGDGDGLVEAVGVRVRTATANVPVVAEELRRWRFFFAIALLLHLALFLRRKGRPADPAARPAAALLATAAVYVTGILLVHVEERYLWFAVLAVVPGAVAGLAPARGWVHEAWGRHLGAGRRRLLHRAVLALLAATLLWPGARLLHHTLVDPHPVAHLAAGLQAQDLAGTRVASDGQWQRTMELCFRLGCRYYGLTSPQHHDDWAEQLRHHGIDYYLVWDERNHAIAGDAPRHTAPGFGGTHEVRVVETGGITAGRPGSPARRRAPMP